MKLIALLKVVNIILIFSFIVTMATILLYRFIPSPLQGSEILFHLHSISGLVFGTSAIVHIVLNWKWFKSSYLKPKIKKERP